MDDVGDAEDVCGGALLGPPRRRQLLGRDGGSSVPFAPSVVTT